MSAAPKNRRLYRRVDEYNYVCWGTSTDTFSCISIDRAPPLRELAFHGSFPHVSFFCSKMGCFSAGLASKPGLIHEQ